MEFIFAVLIAITTVTIWFSSIATLAVLLDDSLQLIQKICQLVICWLIPIIGAIFVLKMIVEYRPDTKLKKLIPWPFRGIIFNSDVSYASGISPTADQAFNLHISHCLQKNESCGSHTSY